MSLFNPLPRHSLRSHAKTLDLSTPHIMGILNVTPDSFSDGGRYNNIDAAIHRSEEMISEGASIIDIGGESTRPNACAVSLQEELNRVIPTVTALRRHFGSDIWLSIDTSRPEVIKAAVAEGADIWNDVRALRRTGAPQMAAELDIPVVLMHMRGEPDTMDGLNDYNDVIADVIAELQQRVEVALAAGVRKEQLIIDPGFGFAKGYHQHVILLRELDKFSTLQMPLMFGISRKRFLGEVLTHSGITAFQEHQKIDRDGVGAAAAIFAVQQGASIIRTHNVALGAQALALWEALCQ